MGFIHNFGRTTIELTLGGRHHLYLLDFENFLIKLLAAGAKLAFFCDGQLQSDKNDEWCRRRDTEFMASYATINENEYDNRRSNKRFGCKSIVKSLLKMIEDEQYGKVIISTQVDCDKAIARYAVSNDALAVVANDSDFVIFQGRYQWWDAGSMNLHQMSAKCFERNSIRKYFELTDQVSDLLTVIR